MKPLQNGQRRGWHVPKKMSRQDVFYTVPHGKLADFIAERNKDRIKASG